jgi:5-methylcytosine-specific restriction endonuclease McrA
MTMQRMIERFKAVEDGADVRELIRGCSDGASNGGPARLVTGAVDSQSIWNDCDRRCHVCSGSIAPDELEIECFGDKIKNSLPVHRGCHEVRAGASSDAIMFAMKFGFWVMMRIQHEQHKSWRLPLVESWIDERGAMAGRLVSAPNVDGWLATSSFETPGELVRFTRNIFLFEREQPKWRNVGHEVPVWDEVMTWKAYKKQLFMPGYKQWKAPRERQTLLPASDILVRTGGVCALCGGVISIEGPERKIGLGLAKDHIHPFCKGGADDLLNLQPLHGFCNGAISSVGPGEIPLSLELGRWLIGQVSDGLGEPWTSRLLKSYGSKLRSERRAATRLKEAKCSSAGNHSI